MTNPPVFDRIAPVVPSNSLLLPVVDAGFTRARALFIGTAGALKFTTPSGDNVTIPNVPVGFFWVAVSQVFATGTTAANIFAVY